MRILTPHPPKKQKIPVDFLILGHPRSGTGYISKLFSGYGIHIGHECIGKNGISCWTFATLNCNHFYGRPNVGEQGINKTCRQDLTYKHLIQNIRNPFDVINSVYFTESSSFSHAFRMMNAVPKIDEDLDLLSQTILSVVRWNEMIQELNPEKVFKVESCEAEVSTYLQSLGYNLSTNLFTDKLYNTRKKSQKQRLSISDYEKVPAAVLQELDKHCCKYRYDNILK